MRSETVSIQPNARHPFIDQSRILAYGKSALSIPTARKQEMTGLSPEGSYVLIDCLARLFCQFEPDRLTRFLLPYSGTFDCISIWRNVLDFESDDITAAHLAADCEIEHCEIAKLTFDLQLGSD